MASNIIAVLINGVVELEYDREQTLPPHQLAFLDKMDAELAEKVVIGEQAISKPDIYQRAQFVAINLISALTQGNDSVAAAMCAYLANRVPDLKQVKVQLEGGQMAIDLVFDEDYVRQVSVEFTPSTDKSPKVH